MKILVVDDSSTMRRIIINTLNKIGYSDYAEAANGREGVEKLAAVPIDMIITDWNMPEMSGVDFIRAVRANDQTKHLPVIMVTTNAAQEDIVQALDAGVNNYVVKPFTPDTIKERIQAAIAARS
jgi:two-component system, chemotaxis family, chemotaxis protein CheY